MFIPAGGLMAAEKVLRIENFQLGLVNYGTSGIANTISPGKVSAVPYADPLEFWRGYAIATIAVGHVITGAKYWTGGVIGGFKTSAGLYRYRFGQEPEILASLSEELRRLHRLANDLSSLSRRIRERCDKPERCARISARNSGGTGLGGEEVSWCSRRA